MWSRVIQTVNLCNLVVGQSHRHCPVSRSSVNCLSSFGSFMGSKRDSTLCPTSSVLNSVFQHASTVRISLTTARSRTTCGALNPCRARLRPCHLSPKKLKIRSDKIRHDDVLMSIFIESRLPSLFFWHPASISPLDIRLTKRRNELKLVQEKEERI